MSLRRCKAIIIGYRMEVDGRKHWDGIAGGVGSGMGRDKGKARG